MPDKYTTVWPALVEAFNTHGLAGLMAFALGYLRIIYDDKESRPMRQFIEALLGACITVVVGLTADAASPLWFGSYSWVAEGEVPYGGATPDKRVPRLCTSFACG